MRRRRDAQPIAERYLQRADATGLPSPHIHAMATITVWHDGGCPLCRAEIALMRRLDRRGAIAFVDVAEPDSACPIGRDQLLARFHAREDGVLLSGAAAFAAMWRAIPALRPLGLMATSPAILSILERAYAAFLRVRPWLQRGLRRKASA